MCKEATQARTTPVNSKSLSSIQGVFVPLYINHHSPIHQEMHQEAMAASKELSDSMLHGSAELVEFPCTICQTRDQRDVESHKYCVDCDSNLCPACTKYHTSFPMMTTHQVVDVSQAPGAHKPLLPTQQCDQHQGKIIDKYCKNHGKLACQTCVSLYHRFCTQLESIPKLSQGISKTNSLQAVKTSTNKLIKELKLKKSSQQQVLFQLDKEETQTQRDVDALCSRLHQYIDDLAQSECAKIASEYQSKRVAVKKEMKVVDDKIDAAETVQTKLNQANSDNESELFVNIKQGEKNEKQGSDLLQALDKNCVRLLKYEINSTLAKLLKDVKSLGEFKKTVVMKLYEEICVQNSSDKNTCNITGICFLQDASMTIIDSENRKLKHLDPTYRFTNDLDLQHRCYDICYVDKTNEVAVTTFDKKRVQFVSVGATMNKTGSFAVGDICGGICCVDDELYICCGKDGKPGCVQVFDISGKPLRTIQYDPAGKPLFSTINYITAYGCKLHISGTEGVITIDKTGNLLARNMSAEVKDAYGLCTLENGDMLVCGDGLMHISEEGRKLNMLMRQETLAVCYDCVHSKLILSHSMTGKIELYNIYFR